MAVRPPVAAIDLDLAPLSPPRRTRAAEAVAVVGAWALVGAVSVVRRGLNDAIPVSWHTVAVSAVEVAPWIPVTFAVLALARRVPPAWDRWAARLAVHVVAGAVAIAAVSAVQAVGIPALGAPPGLAASAGPPTGPPPGQPPGMPTGMPTGPPPGSPDGRSGSQIGPPQLPIPFNVAAYLVVLGIALARASAETLGERQAEAERLRADAARLTAERERLTGQLAAARLDALQMQLNPHFLFNALNAVAALAGDDPEGVRRVVARLSSLLRRVLDAPPDAVVPLAAELDFLRDFLDIQQVRFEGRLAVRESVQPEAFGALVPAFLLQPLVENAVEHGADEVAGGRVEIDARVEGGPGASRRLVVTVCNDATPGTSGTPAERVGLANTRARLAAHAGDAGTLTLRHSPAGTFDAEVALPYRTADGRS